MEDGRWKMEDGRGVMEVCFDKLSMTGRFLVYICKCWNGKRFLLCRNDSGVGFIVGDIARGWKMEDGRWKMEDGRWKRGDGGVL